jgi:hypothetical protein
MYETRNSLTIAVLVVLVGTVGFFWHGREATKLETLQAKYVKLQEDLKMAREAAKRLPSIEEQHAAIGQMWQQAPKKILSVDEPSFSLYYLNWLVAAYDIPIDFDFVLNKRTDQGSFTVYSYSLQGEGTYRDVYRFIWYLTNNPVLYQIRALEMRRAGSNSDRLGFSLDLEGYSINSKWAVDPITTSSFKSQLVSEQVTEVYDAFQAPRSVRVRPRRQRQPARPTLPPRPANLVDVEKAKLQAVTSGTVYLRDERGKLVTLSVGDRVYLGRLTRVDLTNNEAEFQLNKLGKVQKVILGLGYRK